MDSLHAYFGHHNELWGSFTFSQDQSISVSEVWSSKVDEHVDENYQTVHHVINKDAIDQWLTTTDNPSGHGHLEDKPRKCLLRIVWIDAYLKQQRWHVNREILDRLTVSFDQELAQKSFTSSPAGISRLPLSKKGTESAYLCIHPKLAMTWSRCRSSSVINVICMADPRKITIMKSLLDHTFSQKLCGQDMVVPFLAAVICSREVDLGQDHIKRQVREIEVRTGHHEWNSRIEHAAPGDLFSLSAKMSGCRTKLASCARKAEVLNRLIQFMVPKAVDGQSGSQRQSTDTESLNYQVEMLQQRVVMQEIDAAFVQQRVQTQLDALFHIIAEHDALINHEMAKDSRSIALATQQDSLSMKSIAVLTMFFLPGTFVSTLFSMPLFDWADSSDLSTPAGQSSWRSRLGLYMAVTLPLMLLTFVTWRCWMMIQNTRNKRRDGIARRRLTREAQVTESRQLASKSKTLSPDEDNDSE